MRTLNLTSVRSGRRLTGWRYTITMGRLRTECNLGDVHSPGHRPKPRKKAGAILSSEWRPFTATRTRRQCGNVCNRSVAQVSWPWTISLENAVYLNTFAPGIEPLDMTRTDEFASLVESARDLGIEAPAAVRYVSRNVVVNGLRFHVLEWGKPDRPDILLLHGGNQTAHSCTADAAERFVAALPNGRLVTVPHCGHNVHSQNTARFLAAVVPFLEARPS